MEKIKKAHVLIVGAGSSIKKYEKNIQQFINNNKIILIGINHMSNVFVPDYHFWGSGHRWRKYGKYVNDSSVLIFSPGFPKKLIKKYWDKEYKIYKTDERPPGYDKREYDNIYKCFKNTAMTAIFWAYQNKASKISIVGMDGYTYYSEKELELEKFAQHCYGEGFTDGQTYKFGRRKDISYYENLKLLYDFGKKKYGFGFEIMTPTVFKRFYNSTFLEIKEKYHGREPSMEEKKNIKNWEKNRFIKKSKYWK